MVKKRKKHCATVLADNVDRDEAVELPDASSFPDPEVMREVTPPPRKVSLPLTAYLFLRDWGALAFGGTFLCFGMAFVCAAAHIDFVAKPEGAVIFLFILGAFSVGLSVAISDFRGHLRDWRLLKYGSVTKGVVLNTWISYTHARTEIINVALAYTTPDGECRRGDARHVSRRLRLSDDDCDVLFYDSEKPEHVFLLASLPLNSGPEDVTGAFHLSGVLRWFFMLAKLAVLLVICVIFVAEVTFFLGFWSFG